MTKTVVLMGSPRLQSNTDLLANKIMDGIRSAGSPDDVIEKIDLVELQDYVCVACGQCREAGKCMHFPEVTEVLEKMKNADGFVIATPTWWLSTSSHLKIFIDHWGTFLRLDYSSRIEGKRAVLVSCCGNPEINFADKVNAGLEEILSLLGVEVVGSLGVKGVAEVGAVAADTEALEKAFTLGSSLYA